MPKLKISNATFWVILARSKSDTSLRNAGVDALYRPKCKIMSQRQREVLLLMRSLWPSWTSLINRCHLEWWLDACQERWTHQFVTQQRKLLRTINSTKSDGGFNGLIAQLFFWFWLWSEICCMVSGHKVIESKCGGHGFLAIVVD